MNFIRRAWLLKLSLILSGALSVCGELKEFIDLGHGLDNSTVSWDDKRTFESNVSLFSEPFHYAMGEFSTPEHVGTHLDAPFHFWKDGWRLGQIPLKHLILPGVLIDVSQKVGDNRDFLLTSENLSDWERENGALDRDKKYILLIKFGWGDRYVNRTDYFGIGLNSSNPNQRNFPGIGESAANWIASKGSIVGVGVDTASVDSGNAASAVTHRILALKNIYNLENVALAGKNLPSKGFYLIVLPMKLTYGTGGPVRVIAAPESLNQI
nr:PREDICTED: uncharacterized protein LOC109042313 [Bemisia tabaci]